MSIVVSSHPKGSQKEESLIDFHWAEMAEREESRETASDEETHSQWIPDGKGAC